jgi:hypothetical protein
MPPRRRRKTVADYEAEKAASVTAAVAAAKENIAAAVAVAVAAAVTAVKEDMTAAMAVVKKDLSAVEKKNTELEVKYEKVVKENQALRHELAVIKRCSFAEFVMRERVAMRHVTCASEAAFPFSYSRCF